jgi:hypothetical protein
MVVFQLEPEKEWKQAFYLRGCHVPNSLLYLISILLPGNCLKLAMDISENEEN